MNKLTKFLTIALTTCTIALCGATFAHAAPTDTAKAPAVVQAKPIGILTAICNDGGSYYHVTGEHRGACSGHHGVASWADGSPVHSNAARSDYRPAKRK